MLRIYFRFIKEAFSALRIDQVNPNSLKAFGFPLILLTPEHFHFLVGFLLLNSAQCLNRK